MDTSGHATRHTLARRLKLTALALGGSLVALVIAMVFLGKQAQLVRESMAAHTALGGWVGRLQQVSLSLREAESAQRGYLLTGKGEYLTPYQRAVTTLPAALGALDNIPIDDPQLRDLVRDIRSQSDLKLTELGRTISLYQQGRLAAAIALVQSDSGEHSMEQVRADVAKAVDIVKANRSALNSRVDSGSDATGSLATLTVVALIVTVVLATVQIIALMRAQRHSSRELSRQAVTLNAIVDSIPAMVGVCDTELNYKLVNRAYENWRGKGRAELVGRNLEPPPRARIHCTRLECVGFVGYRFSSTQKQTVDPAHRRRAPPRTQSHSRWRKKCVA